MFKSVARENMALSLSAVATGLFALAGITWGLWIDSLVILFDGAYSLVSLLLSLLSLYAARIVRRPASKEYGTECVVCLGCLCRPGDDDHYFCLLHTCTGENDRGCGKGAFAGSAFGRVCGRSPRSIELCRTCSGTGKNGQGWP